ncbi:hypothetical protein [Achromobacter phage Motura]|uniref:Uncharacterized protein n=1 Tax=Achromobacter phage Motura TaxID=2591403 RepID=A0A514CSL6_9CAUD|nr:hypothetical protein H1O15_gp343 [Achromobacter phage Motura]QDH83463.1 hypothetical protein [Achromobacter phage Motura]
MSETTQEALKKVMEHMQSLSSEELHAQLAEYSNDPMTLAFKEAGEFMEWLNEKAEADPEFREKLRLLSAQSE